MAWSPPLISGSNAAFTAGGPNWPNTGGPFDGSRRRAQGKHNQPMGLHGGEQEPDGPELTGEPTGGTTGDEAALCLVGSAAVRLHMRSSGAEPVEAGCAALAPRGSAALNPGRQRRAHPRAAAPRSPPRSGLGNPLHACRKDTSYFDSWRNSVPNPGGPPPSEE
jgi:hypothetical protein